MALRFKKILVTGGAGFIGSNLAIKLKQHFENLDVVAFDNLKRRGSELSLSRLREVGVHFVHGDIRNAEDFSSVKSVDLVIDCAAEPSVHAGAKGDPGQVININLNGTINCLEFARRNQAAFLFLSTSRVYPIDRLNELPFEETDTRYQWIANGDPGFSPAGIAEAFRMDGARSFYGASKLASELLIQEYVYNYQLPALINRCGVVTGPWQMGKVDQGVVMLWVANHLFQKSLNYIGFGGLGKQVRDMLHVDDLFQLLKIQLLDETCWKGEMFHAGGGLETSASLLELTEFCRETTGRKIEIGCQPNTSHVDIRIFVTDSQRARDRFKWSPKMTVQGIVQDIHTWMIEHREQVESVLSL